MRKSSSISASAEASSLFARIFHAERAVLLFLGLGSILYAVQDLPLRVPFYLYRSKLGFGLLLYLLGLLLVVLLIRLADLRQARSSGRRTRWHETFQAYRTAYLTKPILFRDIRLVNCIALMFVVYVHLKHLIPYLNSRIYDPFFAELEQRILGGVHPSTLLIELFGAEGAFFMSEGYVFFYPYLGFVSTFFILQRDSLLAQRYCFSFVLLWFLAILVVYCVPTLGPCFSTPELFTSLPKTKVTELQNLLLVQKEHLEANPRSAAGMYLISGLPSLHFAVVVQGSLFLQGCSRWLGAGSWLFAGLTALTTIYFGWHFVADLLAAVMLVAVVQGIGNRAFTEVRSAD